VELEKRLQMLDKERAEVGHQIEALKREFMEADEQRSRLDLQVGGSVQEVLRGFPGPGRGAGASLPRPSQPAGLSYSFEGADLGRNRCRSPAGLGRVEAGAGDFFTNSQPIERWSQK
ncbi:ANKRD50, partial [Symbiodinium necroappetens]